MTDRLSVTDLGLHFRHSKWYHHQWYHHWYHNKWYHWWYHQWGGHALGLLTGSWLTRPAQTSDTTSFGGMLNLLSFRSDILTSFIYRIILFPHITVIDLALGKELNSWFPGISKFSREKRKRIRRESDQSIAFAKEVRMPPSKAQNNKFIIQQPSCKVLRFHARVCWFESRLRLSRDRRKQQIKHRVYPVFL